MTHHQPTHARIDLGRMLLALALYLGSTLGAVLILRGTPSATEAMGAAALTAAATLAMAWLFAAPSGYPRWSLIASAGAMSAGLLIGAALAPSAAAWDDGTAGLRWMLPWYFMVLGSITPRATKGICAPGHSAAPWILVGVGFAMGAAVVVLPLT